MGAICAREVIGYDATRLSRKYHRPSPQGLL